MRMRHLMILVSTLLALSAVACKSKTSEEVTDATSETEDTTAVAPADDATVTDN